MPKSTIKGLALKSPSIKEFEIFKENNKYDSDQLSIEGEEDT